MIGYIMIKGIMLSNCLNTEVQSATMEARQQKATFSWEEMERRNSIIDKGYNDHIFYYLSKKQEA